MIDMSIPAPALPASAAEGEILKDILALWHHKRQQNRGPSLLDFNPASMFSANGHVVVLDLAGNEPRIRYRFIGMRVRNRIRPLEAEGRCLDEHLPNGAWQTLSPILHHVAMRALPAYVPPLTWLNEIWPDTGFIVLPLATAGKDIDQLMLVFDLGRNEELPRVNVVTPPICEVAGQGFYVPDPMLARLLELWRSACDGSTLPRKSFVDPFALKFIIGNLVLFEIDSLTRLARYRLSGTHIVDRVGMDLTGMRIVDITDERMAIEVQTAVNYCIEMRQPLFVSSARIVRKAEVTFIALMLPISDDGENITHILIGQLYEASAPRWRRDMPDS